MQSYKVYRILCWPKYRFSGRIRDYQYNSHGPFLSVASVEMDLDNALAISSATCGH